VRIPHALLLAVSAIGSAVGPAAAQDPVTPVSPGSVLQVLTGLGLVLFLVLGAAWLLRRVGRVPGFSNQAIKTIGAAAVGTRERVVLLEVSGTWILVGVAPGQVRPLATMPKGEILTGAAQVDASAPFSSLLKRFTDRQHAA